MKTEELNMGRALGSAERNASAYRNGWWRPQIYRTDDSELIAASYQDDQLTVTIANQNAGQTGRIAVPFA